MSCMMVYDGFNFEMLDILTHNLFINFLGKKKIIYHLKHENHVIEQEK